MAPWCLYLDRQHGEPALSISFAHENVVSDGLVLDPRILRSIRNRTCQPENFQSQRRAPSSHVMEMLANDMCRRLMALPQESHVQ